MFATRDNLNDSLRMNDPRSTNNNTSPPVDCAIGIDNRNKGDELPNRHNNSHRQDDDTIVAVDAAEKDDDGEDDYNQGKTKEKKMKKKKNKAIRANMNSDDSSVDGETKKKKKKRKKCPCVLHGSSVNIDSAATGGAGASEQPRCTPHPPHLQNDACAMCTCKKSKSQSMKRPEPEGGHRTSFSPVYDDDYDAVINRRTILFSDFEEESGDDEKYKQECSRQMSRRSAGNAGLFSLINSNTMMKFAIIGTELQNILNVSVKSLQFSLKRVKELHLH